MVMAIGHRNIQTPFRIIRDGGYPNMIKEKVINQPYLRSGSISKFLGGSQIP